MRIHGKLACTQVKYSWILSTYVNEVPDARAQNIDFSSANKLKEKLNQKIEDLQQPQASNHAAASSSGTASASASTYAARIGAFERGNGSALCQTKIKAVALTLIDPFADQSFDFPFLFSILKVNYSPFISA